LTGIDKFYILKTRELSNLSIMCKPSLTGGGDEKKKILIVDDDESMRQSIIRILAK